MADIMAVELCTTMEFFLHTLTHTHSCSSTQSKYL